MIHVKNSVASWLGVFCLLVSAGCDSITSGPNANIEFEDSILGIQKGDQVYLLGAPVAEVGRASIVNGKAFVSVSLRDDNIFRPDQQVLFYIASDQQKPGRRCLVAVIHSLPAAAGKPRFRGFGSKTEMMLRMTAEKAESWWKGLGISN